MLSRSLRLVPTLPRPFIRSFSSFRPLSNASPEWESLIGGKQGIERKRQLFEQKYQHVLEAKAKEQGITLEELKEKAKEALKVKQATDRIKLQGEKGPVEAGSVDTRNGGGGGATTKEGDNVVKPLPSSQKPTQAPYKKGDSPVKVSYLYLPSIELTRRELTVSTALISRFTILWIYQKLPI